MSRRAGFLLIGGCAALLAAAGLMAAAQDKKAMEPPKPGPEHDLLRSLEGSWDIEARHCLDHGGGAVTKGTETCALGCGGFWLITDHRSEMMGKPFLGHGVLGFDPLKRKYVLAWASSMSGTLIDFEGAYDKAAKTLTLTGDIPGPEGKASQVKIAYGLKDPEHLTFTLVGIGASAGKDCT